jgi:hypothetical protein
MNIDNLSKASRSTNAFSALTSTHPKTPRFLRTEMTKYHFELYKRERQIAAEDLFPRKTPTIYSSRGSLSPFIRELAGADGCGWGKIWIGMLQEDRGKRRSRQMLLVLAFRLSFSFDALLRCSSPQI